MSNKEDAKRWEQIRGYLLDNWCMSPDEENPEVAKVMEVATVARVAAELLIEIKRLKATSEQLLANWRTAQLIYEARVERHTRDLVRMEDLEREVARLQSYAPRGAEYDWQEGGANGYSANSSEKPKSSEPTEEGP